MFKFIHTADIHLDSPLRGLEAHEGAPVEEIRGATRRAFTSMVDLALQEPVDFILIAGDVFDGDWKDYNTGLFFIREMGRLEQAGIKVFMIAGNHDATSSITRTLSLPANVVRFSDKICESVELPEFKVMIHGRSYQTAAVTDNLAAEYPNFSSNHFNIGLLHTSLTGRDGHASYAPCSRGDLASKGYEYWALGHVHAREVVSEDPHIIFPGNLQGRHIREVGAKSVTLVTVDDGTIVDIKPVEVDVLRWDVCRLDVSDCDSEKTLIDKVRAGMAEAAASTAGRPLALRLVLEGLSPLHEELQARSYHWLEEFRAVSAALGTIWLEQVKFRTSRNISLEQLIGEDSPLYNVLQAAGSLQLDDEMLDLLANELVGLKAKLPAELTEVGALLDCADEQLQEIQEDVREMLLAGLLRQGEER